MDALWTIEECTLPTVERPVRVREFSELFGAAVRVERLAADRLRFELPNTPAVAGEAAQLAVREGECCSFFTFTLTSDQASLRLEVGVPKGRAEILDALAGLAQS
ncbi:MAG TPA: hypothetical protein VK925_00030 [Jiangellaceae bacterium]|nr:hypothetical protein [Jiangellaceae bacterium]